MLNKFMCLIGWHDWTFLARDNFTRIFRCCNHCHKRQELMREYILGPQEYWQ